MSVIRTVNLVKIYSGGAVPVPAVRGVDLKVEAGEFVAVMGPSGSGKSTLMHLIGLLDRPTSGRLSLLGEDTTRHGHDQLARLRNRRIGFVFQAYNLLARSTTFENVELPLLYSGLGRTQRQLSASTALEAVGLAHRADHWPSELSGGEQQRAAIARALVGDPMLVLADEPTGALDSRTGLGILALFQALNRAGRTIVVVTHDAHVAHHARRILRLQDGEIVGDEPVPSPSDAQAAIEVEPVTTMVPREKVAVA
jgi:putative ABC transport system ATP-binding protein